MPRTCGDDPPTSRGRDCVKVAIGGAPVTQAYADEIGADLFTEDAVSLAGRLLEEFA